MHIEIHTSDPDHIDARQIADLIRSAGYVVTGVTVNDQDKELRPVHRYRSCPDRNQNDPVIGRMDEEQHKVTCPTCCEILAAMMREVTEDEPPALSDCERYGDPLVDCGGRMIDHVWRGLLCENHLNRFKFRR